MFDNFNLEGCIILRDAEQERKKLHHPYVGSEHLFLSILKNSNEVSDIFKEYNVTYNTFKKELLRVVGCSEYQHNDNLYTPLLKKIILSAQEFAKDDEQVIKPIHYVLAILDEQEGIAYRLLIAMDVDVEKLHKDLFYEGKANSSLLFSVGVSLNKTVDLAERIIGREEEINRIIEVLLRKKKNNPLLIGEAGVGKTALVEEIARRIEIGNCPKFLKDKSIVMLEMGSLVAGTKYRGEFEEKLTKIINELVANKNTILFIDEIHTMVNAGGAEGAINAADIIKPYLARGQIKCIGATTLKEYDKYILNDKALDRRFEKIYLNEPNDEELENLLMQVKCEYEKYHNVIVTKRNIDDIIFYSNKYIQNRYNPDKCIDILDTVCAYVRCKNESKSTKESKNIIEKIKKDKMQAVKRNDFNKAFLCAKKELALKNNSLIQNYTVSKEDILQVINKKNNVPSLKMHEGILNKQIKNKNFINRFLKALSINNDSLSVTPTVLRIRGDKEEKTKIKENLIKCYKSKYNTFMIDIKDLSPSLFEEKLFGGNIYSIDYLFKPLLNNTFSVIIIDNYDEASEKVKAIFNNIIKNGSFKNMAGENIYFNNSILIFMDSTNNKSSVGFIREEKESNILDKEIIDLDKLKEEDFIINN